MPWPPSFQNFLPPQKFLLDFLHRCPLLAVAGLLTHVLKLGVVYYTLMGLLESGFQTPFLSITLAKNCQLLVCRYSGVMVGLKYMTYPGY
jgi:hypothetical protein